MKKSLVALAALSAISAFADVDVSGGIKMYGVLDQAVMNQSWVSAGSASTTSGNNTSNTGLYAASATSRLGVRGSRDLGEDVKGLFQIEIELAPQNSSDQAGGAKNNGLLSPKNRGTFVGLEKKDIGSIKLGTQETTAYELFAMDVNGRVEYKPQVWRYVASNSTQDRAGNSIKVTSAEISGFTFAFMAAPQELANGTNAKSTPAFKSIGAKYHAGALKAAVVMDSISSTDPTSANLDDAVAGRYRLPGDQYEGVVTVDGGKTKYANSTNGVDLKRNIAGVTYDFGSASINWIYADSGNANGRLNTNTFGVRVPMDKVAFAMSYGSGTYQNNVTTSTYGSVSDVTIGGYYNFDKSTAAYLLHSNAKNSFGASAVVGTTTTTAVGVQYKF